jgi:hypothetical protein
VSRRPARRYPPAAGRVRPPGRVLVAGAGASHTAPGDPAPGYGRVWPWPWRGHPATVVPVRSGPGSRARGWSSRRCSSRSALLENRSPHSAHVAAMSSSLSWPYRLPRDAVTRSTRSALPRCKPAGLDSGCDTCGGQMETGRDQVSMFGLPAGSGTRCAGGRVTAISE